MKSRRVARLDSCGESRPWWHWCSAADSYAGAQALTSDELVVFQDQGGWEYLSISDVDNGFPTTHTCFDGNGRGPCKGNLTFAKDNTFRQSVTIHGKSLDRHGTYVLDGHDVTFIDELGTKDGPYAVQLDVPLKKMTLNSNQAGVIIRIQLQLETEFRKAQSRTKK